MTSQSRNIQSPLNAQITPERENLLHLFIEHTPAAVAMLDREMRYLLVSKRWLSDYGLEGENIIGRCHYDLFPKTPETSRQLHQNALAGVAATCEAELFHRADGTAEWLKWEVHPWHNSAEEVGGVILYTEVVTKRRQIEEALRQSEARFQKLSANVPGIIYQFMLRTDGFVCFPFVSPSCYEIYELPPEVIQQDANSIIQLTHPDDLSDFQRSVALSAQTLQPWHWEGRVITPSGKLKWIQGASRPELQANGDILWDGLLMDITARKQAEAELQKAKEELEIRVQARTADLSRAVRQLKSQILERQRAEEEKTQLIASLQASEQRLSLLIQQTPLAVVEWNTHLEVTAWNPAAEKIFGYSKQEAIGRRVIDLMVPENAEDQVSRVMQDLLTQAGGSRSTNENVTKDGRAIICEWYNASLVDSNAQLIGVASLALDITERQLAEAALRENEERYRSVVEQASDGIFLVDVHTKRIVETNASCCRSLGYTPEEMLQLSFYDVVAVEPEVIDRHTEHILQERHSFVGEGQHRHKDGSIIDVEVSVNIISYSGREVFCIVFRDVTERKLAQQTQARLTAILEATTDFVGIADNQGQAIYVNSAGRKIMGVNQDFDITKTQMSDFYPPSVREFINNQALPTVIEKGVWSGETFFQPFGSSFRVPVSQVFMAHKSPDGEVEFFSTIARDITERKRAEEQQQKLIALIESSSDFIGIATLEGQAIYVNEAGQKMVGLEGMEAVHRTSVEDYFTPEDLVYVQEQILPVIMTQGRWEGEFRFRHFQTGAVIPVHYNLFTVKDRQTGQPIAIATVTRDITERKHAEAALMKSEAQLRENNRQLETTLRELQYTQAQLVQTEKMSSLGQLVAGIAHEINNPVNFIFGNLTHAGEYTQDLLDLLHLYQLEYPQPTETLQEKMEAIDLEFLCEDLPKLLSSMKLGADRIRKIVLSLRSFSRLDEADKKPVNIHEGIDSTLLILQNRLKASGDHPEIPVNKEYGDLPEVECYAGQLNQVFMNILANAIDALEERDKQRSAEEMQLLPSHITIRTRVVEGNRVAIHIIDNGRGMTEMVKNKLFDPFFTTKPVGKGTGLGLSISYQIVTEKHGGELKCFSQPGIGTEFVIEIPIS